MSRPAPIASPPAVVVASCRAGGLRGPSGSDSALLAAILSARHDELLVIRSGPWEPDPITVGGCRLRMIRPPAGRPGNAGGAVRRLACPGPVPVWGETDDLAALRGFARAAQSPESGVIAHERIESLLGTARPRCSESEPPREVVATVLGSRPHGLDARGVVFAVSLAAVTGQPMRVVLPRGARNVETARRYARRLSLPLEIEVVGGPTWLELDRADAVILDRESESASEFGAVLIRVGEHRGLPIIDLPRVLPVGGRDARRFGLPMLDAVVRTKAAVGATVGAR